MSPIKRWPRLLPGFSRPNVLAANEWQNIAYFGVAIFALSAILK